MDNKRRELQVGGEKERLVLNNPVTQKINKTISKLMKSKAFYITKLRRRHSRGIIIKINVSKITESGNG